MNSWAELKFDRRIPQCRTFHASTTFNGNFVVYGGSDSESNLSLAEDVWILEPIVNKKPNWIKLKITDRYFLLPDYIRRHKMVVRKYENKTILLVIGGEKSFRSSE